MLSTEILQKIRQIQIRTSHLVTEVLAGDYQSTFKGRGMEFEETRVYSPGDDVRFIDWNTTARTGVPHIKSFREERELSVILLIDVSASGKFGSQQRIKNEVAAEVAAILAHTAMRKNDKVGAILFTDQVEEFIPPKKGRSHIWRVLREILTFEPKSQGTHISGALDYLNQVIHKKSVVFLISDFLDEDYERSLMISNRRHDIIAVSVLDPREEHMPASSIVELEDAESGEVFLFDAGDPKGREVFQKLSQKTRQKRQDRFRASGVDEIEIHTDQNTIDPIINFFRSRMAKFRR